MYVLSIKSFQNVLNVIEHVFIAGLKMHHFIIWETMYQLEILMLVMVSSLQRKVLKPIIDYRCGYDGKVNASK